MKLLSPRGCLVSREKKIRKDGQRTEALYSCRCFILVLSITITVGHENLVSIKIAHAYYDKCPLIH